MDGHLVWSAAPPWWAYVGGRSPAHPRGPPPPPSPPQPPFHRPRAQTQRGERTGAGGVGGQRPVQRPAPPTTGCSTGRQPPTSRPRGRTPAHGGGGSRPRQPGAEVPGSPADGHAASRPGARGSHGTPSRRSGLPAPSPIKPSIANPCPLAAPPPSAPPRLVPRLPRRGAQPPPTPPAGHARRAGKPGQQAGGAPMLRCPHVSHPASSRSSTAPSPPPPSLRRHRHDHHPPPPCRGRPPLRVAPARRGSGSNGGQRRLRRDG